MSNHCNISLCVHQIEVKPRQKSPLYERYAEKTQLVDIETLTSLANNTLEDFVETDNLSTLSEILHLAQHTDNSTKRTVVDNNKSAINTVKNTIKNNIGMMVTKVTAVDRVTKLASQEQILVVLDLDFLLVGKEKNPIISDKFCKSLKDTAPKALSTVLETALPTTWLQKTASGGLHAIFAASETQRAALLAIAAKGHHFALDAAVLNCEIFVADPSSAQTRFVLLAPSVAPDKFASNTLGTYKTLTNPLKLCSIQDELIESLREAQSQYNLEMSKKVITYHTKGSFKFPPVDYVKDIANPNFKKLKEIEWCINTNGVQATLERLSVFSKFSSLGVSYNFFWVSLGYAFLDAEMKSDESFEVWCDFCLSVPDKSDHVDPPKKDKRTLKSNWRKTFFNKRDDHLTQKITGATFSLIHALTCLTEQDEILQILEETGDLDADINIIKMLSQSPENNKQTPSTQTASTQQSASDDPFAVCFFGDTPQPQVPSSVAETLMHKPILQQMTKEIEQKIQQDAEQLELIKRAEEERNTHKKVMEIELKAKEIVDKLIKNDTVGGQLFNLCYNTAPTKGYSAALASALVSVCPITQNLHKVELLKGLRDRGFQKPAIAMVDENGRSLVEEVVAPVENLGLYVLVYGASSTGKDHYYRFVNNAHRIFATIDHGVHLCSHGIGNSSSRQAIESNTKLSKAYITDKMNAFFKSKLIDTADKATVLLLRQALRIKNSHIVRDEFNGESQSILADDKTLNLLAMGASDAIKQLHSGNDIGGNRLKNQEESSSGCDGVSLHIFGTSTTTGSIAKYDLNTGKVNRFDFNPMPVSTVFVGNNEGQHSLQFVEFGKEEEKKVVDLFTPAFKMQCCNLHFPEQPYKGEDRGRQVDLTLTTTKCFAIIREKLNAKLSQIEQYRNSTEDTPIETTKKTKGKKKDTTAQTVLVEAIIKDITNELEEILALWNPFDEEVLSKIIHMNVDDYTNNQENWHKLFRDAKAYRIINMEEKRKGAHEANEFAKRVLTNTVRIAANFCYCFTEKSGSLDCITFEAYSLIYEWVKLKASCIEIVHAEEEQISESRKEEVEENLGQKILAALHKMRCKGGISLRMILLNLSSNQRKSTKKMREIVLDLVEKGQLIAVDQTSSEKGVIVSIEEISEKRSSPLYASFIQKLHYRLPISKGNLK